MPKKTQTPPELAQRVLDALRELRLHEMAGQLEAELSGGPPKGDTGAIREPVTLHRQWEPPSSSSWASERTPARFVAQGPSGPRTRATDR